MPEDAVKLTPTVLWAQRKDRLLITIDLPNPEHPRVNLEEEGRLTFSATAGKDGEERREYEVVLEFLHPVNAKDSKISVGNRQVFVVVMKTEEVSGREPIPRKPIPPPRERPVLPTRPHGLHPAPRSPRWTRRSPGAYPSRYARVEARPPGAGPVDPSAPPRKTDATSRPFLFSASSDVASATHHATHHAHPPTPNPSTRSSPASTGRGCSGPRARCRTSRPTLTSGSTRTRRRRAIETRAFDLAQLRDLSTYEHSTYEKDFYGEEEDSDDDDDMPDLERI